jgi:transcriptional regulator with XRE-family HTH domain
MSLGSRYRRGLYARAFSAVLREHRTRAGITQEELAFRGELDRTFPSLLERGLRTPTPTIICVPAEALQVEPATLVSEAAARARQLEAANRANRANRDSPRWRPRVHDTLSPSMLALSETRAHG